MTTAEIILLILGMAFVTYIPRAIPAAFIDKIRFGKKLEKFLMLIPYTAMTALIVPGIFFVDDGNVLVGITGLFVAGILAWKKAPVMVSVLGAIAAVFLLYLIL